MTDEAALLAAIAAHPSDDTPRLILADYLDDTPGSTVCPECGGRRETEQTMKVGRPGGVWSTEPIGLQPCIRCDGSGEVSNCNAEYAEFLRLQLEIARVPMRIPTTDNCPRCESLGRVWYPYTLHPHARCASVSGCGYAWLPGSSDWNHGIWPQLYREDHLQRQLLRDGLFDRIWGWVPGLLMTEAQLFALDGGGTHPIGTPYTLIRRGFPACVYVGRIDHEDTLMRASSIIGLTGIRCVGYQPTFHAYLKQWEWFSDMDAAGLHALPDALFDHLPDAISQYHQVCTSKDYLTEEAAFTALDVAGLAYAKRLAEPNYSI